MDESLIKKSLEEKFLRYLTIASTSDEKSKSIPSSKGQIDLGKLLKDELENLGLEDVRQNEFGVVSARLKSNTKGKNPKIGFVAHLDTVDVGLNDQINPIIIRDYDGSSIIQDNIKNIIFDPGENPEILSYKGDDIILSDGNSVLGADNKAAISNIMTALEYLVKNPKIKHGDIYIAFVPDEEIGLRGVRKIDFDKFDVDYAYTIDSCQMGELVLETFNACSANIEIIGKTAHPMNSKNNLINPIMIANDFINLLDKKATPENTEGREGYIWVTDINSTPLKCQIDLNIRDHNKNLFEDKKDFIKKSIDLLRDKYPKARINLSMLDIYANIKYSINKDNISCINKLKEAFKRENIDIKQLAMRGGTDGSYLSSIGILTPNYFTGAHNFHSNKEFLPINSFYKSTMITIALMKGENN